MKGICTEITPKLMDAYRWVTAVRMSCICRKKSYIFRLKRAAKSFLTPWGGHGTRQSETHVERKVEQYHLLQVKSLTSTPVPNQEHQQIRR